METFLLRRVDFSFRIVLAGVGGVWVFSGKPDQNVKRTTTHPESALSSRFNTINVR